jgi:hypothetical protein
MLRPRLLLGFIALAFGLWYVAANLWALVSRRMAQSSQAGRSLRRLRRLDDRNRNNTERLRRAETLGAHRLPQASE